LRHLGGNSSAASQIFKQLLSTWDAFGFGPPEKPPAARGWTQVGRCQTQFDALYTTRSFGYFLLAQRATDGWSGFEVAKGTIATLEAADL
jgi:hypothetical protein